MENHQQQGWNGFIRLCAHIKDEKTVNAVFELLFTAEERQDVAMRYLIIKELLDKEKTQREIAKDLNVSIAKITRGSNELKRMSVSLISFVQEQLLKGK